MFINTQLALILGPAMAIWALVFLAVRLRTSADPVARSWSELKLSTIATGTMMLLLWFALPITPVLSTFGYPADVEAVSQPQRVLAYLQDYNRALVRTAEVVHWLLFIFVWWFLTAIYSLSNNRTADSPPRTWPSTSLREDRT